MSFRNQQKRVHCVAASVLMVDVQLDRDERISKTLKYDIETCQKLEQATQLSKEDLKKKLERIEENVRRLRRTTSFDCRKLSRPLCSDPLPPGLPEDWSGKTAICRGVHNVMAWLGPDLPREYLNVTQTAAITKGAFSLGGVTKNTEGALGDLVEVASPIAIAGATGGALINILKVIDRMCMDKWEFFQWCEVGVSMASIVLAVAALTLAFTGVGVPVAAFALALAGFMVRRGGALVCSNGGIKGISRAARTFFEQMWTAMKEEFQKKEDEVGEFFRTLEPGDIAQKAVTAAQSFFQLFYWLLKNIGKAIEELPAKFMKDVASKVAHALGRDNEIQVQNDREAQEAALREKKKRRICCAAETAREVDKEIAQDELVKEFVEKFETEIVEKEA